MPKSRRFLNIFIWIIAIGTGVFAANFAGSWFQSYRTGQSANEAHARQLEMSAAILSQNDSLAIGQTLKNMPLVYLSGEPADLASLITEPTLVTYIEPGCPGCDRQVQTVLASCTTAAEANRIILILAGETVDLEQWVAAVENPPIVLYDKGRKFGFAHEIHSFPFNMIVDRGLVIQEVRLWPQSEKELKELVALNGAS